MITSSLASNISVPEECFSHYYLLNNGTRIAILYNTRLQINALLEDDSAEVFRLIYQGRGDLSGALDYILRNGEFGAAYPEEAAAATLTVFVSELLESGYLVKKSEPVEADQQPKLPAQAEGGAPMPNSDLERQIGPWMADNHILYDIVLELTYRCNENCIHCYCPRDRSPEELTTADVISLIDEFKALGGFHVHLTGGEMFMRKDIKEILSHLRETKLLCDLTSNLTLLNSDDLLDSVVRLHPRSVACSIYSADPSVHDAVTRSAGSLERSLQAIRNLRHLDIPVVIKCPLMSVNVDGWRSIANLAQELDCKYQFDLNITARNDGDSSPLGYRVQDPDKIAEVMSSSFFHLAINNEPLSNLSSVDQNASLCGAGAAELVISPDGTIRPCIGMVRALGKFPQDSLQSVWEDSSFVTEWSRHKWKDVKGCSTCDKFRYCFRCPGSWLLETGSPFQPSDYTCKLAEIWSRC
jgi:radical SAM protein with 4Fe4S-binding SPASM domain